jgi:hypothetical protein
MPSKWRVRLVCVIAKAAEDRGFQTRGHHLVESSTRSSMSFERVVPRERRVMSSRPEERSPALAEETTT